MVREIALLDVNEQLANGQALDLLHGAPSTADQVISAGGYEHVPDSDVVCITESNLPEVVTENEEGILTVAYGNMVGLLIEAIKEQQEQINVLQEQLNGLAK